MKVTKTAPKATKAATVSPKAGKAISAKAEKVEAPKVREVSHTGYSVKQILALMMSGVNPSAWGMNEICDKAVHAAITNGESWKAAFAKLAKGKAGFLLMGGKHWQVLAGEKRGEFAMVAETVKLGKGLTIPTRGVVSLENARMAHGAKFVHWVSTVEEARKIIGNQSVFQHCGAELLK